MDGPALDEEGKTYPQALDVVMGASTSVNWEQLGLYLSQAVSIWTTSVSLYFL